ncbi:MAG: hypothetical protein L3J06_03455 [Cyclobacteriaceae bacterium]|nr:hypothetical protein [Cyclobacteriaceae bacterium]
MGGNLPDRLAGKRALAKKLLIAAWLGWPCSCPDVLSGALAERLFNITANYGTKDCIKDFL